MSKETIIALHAEHQGRWKNREEIAEQMIALIGKLYREKNIVVSVGANTEFSGMLTLNETGTFYWEMLKEGTSKEEMLVKVLKEYDVTQDEASKDLDEFLSKLSEAKILEE